MVMRIRAAALAAFCAWVALLQSALALAQETSVHAAVDRAGVRISEAVTVVRRAVGAGDPRR